MKINKPFIALVALLATVLPNADAQNSVISPYSRFGYGLLSEQSNAMQRSMGGVGYAMRSGREINFMNPASYAAMDSLTFLFDMAVDAKSLKSKEGDIKGDNFTGGLDYITMQVPITKWLGASAGLIPFSEVGYTFSSDITNGQNSRQGSGGFNELYVGFGARPLTGLSVGLNVSYLFGTLVNSTYVYATNATTSLFERQVEVRDYRLRFGVQYGRMFGKDHYVTVGAVYSPKKSFHGHAYGIKYDVSTDALPDTISDINLRGNAQMAETWGLGVNYKWQDRVMAEIDFTYQPWKNVKAARVEGFDNTSTFNNRWRVGVGAQYVHRSRGSWLQRVNYRVGAFYCNDYIKVGDNSVRERGVSVGFGLPAPAAKTMINLGFEFRNRQAHPQPMVKENYFVMTLGINFNQVWFWRNKIR